MGIVIGIVVVLTLVIGLCLWTARRSAKAGGTGSDVEATARAAKLQAQADATRWGAGT